MLGKACVVGPHTDHFEAEVQALLDCDGLRQVQDVDELGRIFSQWLDHPQEARQMGMRAQAQGHDRNMLIKRYIEALSRYSVLN